MDNYAENRALKIVSHLKDRFRILYPNLRAVPLMEHYICSEGMYSGVDNVGYAIVNGGSSKKVLRHGVGKLDIRKPGLKGLVRILSSVPVALVGGGSMSIPPKDCGEVLAEVTPNDAYVHSKNPDFVRAIGEFLER
jgi:hypothetical protein